MLTAQALSATQERMKRLLEQEIHKLHPLESPLKDALSYALLLPGKRIRPHMVYEVGALFDCSQEALDALAVAIECLHTYSLVHDDLPSMDDDALRRGHPTTHIQYDEATAILVGDTLHTLAFEILSRPLPGIHAEQSLRIIQAFAHAAGYHGMCGGQAMDIHATEQTISLDHLIDIHERKTGALIQAAAEMPCIVAQAQDEITLKITKFAQLLGHAFQIQDDILDVIGTTQTLGKPQGSDDHANKSTYPKLLGLQEAKRHAVSLIDDALTLLNTIPHNTARLESFALFMIERLK